MSSAGGGSVIRQFRTDYKKRDRHSAAEVNRLGKILNNARGENGVEVRVSPLGLIIRGSDNSGGGSGSSAYPGSGWSFGISIAGAVVTVYTGGIKWGKKGWAWSSETSVSINTDGQYIPVSCKFGSIGAGAISIGSATTDTAFITDTSTQWRSFIARFNYSGSASVDILGVCGQIVDLSGEYSAS